MAELTLLRSGHELSDPQTQLTWFENDKQTPDFQHTLRVSGNDELRALSIETLQLNLGKVCNQTCTHCHVDAGPDRRESMSEEVAKACLQFAVLARIKTLDLTGGAPEMNASFKELVHQGHQQGYRIIDRCNLTILTAPGYTDLPEFLASHQVEIVASLPCYLEENVDKQRGDRVFQRSIAALRKLNDLGYGHQDSQLKLTLVYNPTGTGLPPNQAKLEEDYRRELRARYGIEFSQLFTITNMPISRFLAELIQKVEYERYMHKLVSAYNPATLEGLMCRSMISVDWLGNLYDCDFNQMLGLEIDIKARKNIRDLQASDIKEITSRRIVTGKHCYGCTAGSGSSCSGSLK